MEYKKFKDIQISRLGFGAMRLPVVDGNPQEIDQGKLDEMVELAFDDQCTGANPVYPLMDDIKHLYINAFKGIV